LWWWQRSLDRSIAESMFRSLLLPSFLPTPSRSFGLAMVFVLTYGWK
jgi:hypothetical protein